MFRRLGKTSRSKNIFVMVNDPSRTSAKAMKALRKLRIDLKKIPRRSPDLNPIENLLHVVKKRLREDAKEKCINKETWDDV